MPESVRRLLTTIAVFDDIGAVAIIALVCTDHLVLPGLLSACAGTAVFRMASRA